MCAHQTSPISMSRYISAARANISMKMTWILL
jgi:hypothetical protein